jgi:electron transport complex protein RnfD
MKALKLFKREIKPVKRGNRGTFLSGAVSVPGIMLHVLAALLPVMIWAIYLFGLRALTVIAACVASSVGTEALITLILYKKPRVSDLTAVVSGVMLALTLPAAVPIWVALIGGVIAMVIKQLSGGAGKNFLNPALASRTVLMLIFGKMMIYTAPFTKLPLISNVSGDLAAETAMTALNDGRFPNEAVFDLLSGKCAGNMGEISALLIIIGGIFLLSRGIISYKIPASFLLTFAAVTYVFPRIDIDSSYALYSLISGGVLFAAVFMATDHTTTPCTTIGQVLFGIGCGGLTVIFRYSGLFYDGAYPAVLIMNELSRPLDLLAYRLTGPKTAKKKKKTEKKAEEKTEGEAQ